MFVPIFILLIAAVAILCGLFLSPRSHHSDSDERPISYVNSRNRRASRALMSDVRGRTTRSRRPILQTHYEYQWEPRVGALSWAGVRGSFSSRSLFGALLILGTVIVAGIWLWSHVFSSPTLLQQQWPDVAVSASPPASSTTPTIKETIRASSSMVRLSQLDPAQYRNDQEYKTWAYSACSTAAMTEVINAYNTMNKTGKQYRITDILNAETAVHAITPELGLLEPKGIDRTVARFNFKTTWLNKPTAQDLIRIGNSGRPIIIGFPPERWSGGHLLIARGGNSKSVYLTDSSKLNMQVMDINTFNKYWAGFAVIVEPK
ncbi:hypothetical protein [Ktedonospora formicarum]|uniref:Peptidase C39-like domain-containing protein n=1 Tax=Ktedonospora formicarum TaxID=2778364 RepID=A0A8J3HYM6_9CHLR|nr:hypothetical protein [Ktedonospora formicarum]GHO43042.1 hypothetical protein KSX_12050 [Ktedonospora formicarum]